MAFIVPQKLPQEPQFERFALGCGSGSCFLPENNINRTIIEGSRASTYSQCQRPGTTLVLALDAKNGVYRASSLGRFQRQFEIGHTGRRTSSATSFPCA